MKRIWLLLLCLLFSLTLGSYNRAAAAGILSDVEVGFNNSYNLGEWTPIRVTINNTGHEIEGSLEVVVPASRDTDAIYSVPVNVPASSVKEYTIYAKIQRYTRSLDISLVGKNNKVIEKSTIKTLTHITEQGYMLGILTEDNASLGYWKDGLDTHPIFSDYQPISLSVESLPDRAEVMDNFGIIVLNNIETGNLREKQISALDSWVKGGGILIIGTGPNARRTLSGLSPGIIPVTTETTKNLESLGALEAKAGRPISGDSLPMVDLKSDKGFVVLQEDDIPLISLHSVGGGFVYTSAFDLGTEPILSWPGNKVLWERVLSDTLPYQRVMSLQTPSYMYINTTPQDLLGNIQAMELPPASIILFIFLLYLGITGPLNYIVLKKLDKREWSWVTIPALSIIFAGIIYGFGFTTKGNETIMNTISIVNLHDGSSQAELREHVGVFFPGRGDYIIDIDSSSLVSVGQDMDYGYYHQASDTAQVEARVTQGGSSRVEFDNVNVWMMKAFMIDKQLVDMGSVDAELTFNNNEITGRLTNNTDFPLENFVLHLGSAYQKLGNIASGESKNVSLDLSGLYNDMVDDVFPYGNFSTDASEYRKQDIRRDLFWSLVADQGGNVDYSPGSNLKADFFAFFEGGAEDKVRINNKEPDKAEGSGIILGTVDIGWNMTGPVFIPDELVRVTLEEEMSHNVKQDQHEPYTHFYDYDSYAVYSVDLDPFLDLEDMVVSIETGSDMGKTTIYNSNEDEFLEVDGNTIYVFGENMDWYIGDNNKAYIKLEPLQHEYMAFVPPSVTIEGRID
ncbi:MAG TPA: hypothetical protein VFD33_00080 [Bacillota bacterium]|nr:hypothetical protein [Bacillota bacterium]